MTDPDQRPPCPGSCSGSGYPVWCPACKRLARSSITEIDRLMIWLEQQSDGFSPRTPGTFVSGSTSVLPPSPSPTADLLDKAYGDLIKIEREWRMVQGYAPTRRTSLGRTAHDRAMTMAFLSAHLDSMLLLDGFTDPIRKLINWRTVLQRFAHAEPERREKPGRCPRCHMVNVLRFDAEAEMIECSHCPAELSVEEYEAEVTESPDPAVVPESRRVLGLLEA